jgi:hypothetical protein
MKAMCAVSGFTFVWSVKCRMDSDGSMIVAPMSTIWIA